MTTNTKLADSTVNYQRMVFEEIIDMKHRMQNLASYIQNPIPKEANSDEILESINQLNIDYDNAINKLLELRQRSQGILMYHVHKKRTGE